MSLAVSPAPLATEHWVKGMERYALECLRSGTTHATVAYGLSCLSGDIRTVQNIRGSQLGVFLPVAVLKDLGLQKRDQVQFLPIGPGVLLINARDSLALSRAEIDTVERLAKLRAAARPKPQLQHNEIRCEHCSTVFCWPTKWKRLCARCAEESKRRSKRGWWHREGKLALSYLKKLHVTRPARAIDVEAALLA